MTSLLNPIVVVAWEDVRGSFLLDTLAAFVIWGACNIGELAVRDAACLRC